MDNFIEINFEEKDVFHLLACTITVALINGIDPTDLIYKNLTEEGALKLKKIVEEFGELYKSETVFEATEQYERIFNQLAQKILEKNI